MSTPTGGEYLPTRLRAWGVPDFERGQLIRHAIKGKLSEIVTR